MITLVRDHPCGDCDTVQRELEKLGIRHSVIDAEERQVRAKLRKDFGRLILPLLLEDGRGYVGREAVEKRIAELRDLNAQWHKEPVAGTEHSRR